MGVHIDGVYLAPLRLESSIEVGVTVFVVLKLLLSLVIAAYWVYNHNEFKKPKLKLHVLGLISMGLVWQVIQIMFLYVDETVVSHWLHGYWATLAMMTHFWLQMEIMGAFAVKSKIFTQKRLKRIGIAMTVFWFLTTGSYWAMIPTLGREPPAFISLWFNLGYPLFLVGVIIYDNFQSIYIIRSMYRMMTNKAKLMELKVSSVDENENEAESQVVVTGMYRLVALVVLALIIDWTAVISTIYSLQVTGGKKIQTIMNVFAGSIAFSHIDLVAFILHSVKSVKLKTSNKSSSNLRTDQKSHSNLRSQTQLDMKSHTHLEMK
jgi:hypothetical protein